MNIQSSRYREVHARSLADPEGFWGEAARGIDWIEPAKKVFDPSMGLYGRWFAGAVVNTCYNALDRHVAGGRGNQLALIHDSPLAGSVTKLTYAEMLHEVRTLAAVMADFGVAKGDRVILYMPMVPEAMVAMLACARIGAVHSVVFGGFAAKELATRIEDAKPKLIFSASCGLEPGRIVQYKPLLDEAIKLSSVKPQACVILQRPQQACELTAGRDHDWAELRAKAVAAKKSVPCVPVLATDPLYILYTSGTTGKPKGVILTHNNLFWASVGLTHTIDWGYRYRFLSVAPLFHVGGLAPIFGNIHSGCTTVFMPNFDPVKIWDLIVAEKINFMMTVPTMLQFMLFAPDIQKKDLSSIKHIVCGGSAVPLSLITTYDKMGIKIDQVYGITEYAGAVTFWTPDMGMDKSNSMGKTVFHGHVKIFRPDSHEELPVGEVGEIGCFGPQVFKGYWNNPEATAAAIKNGYYRSGDMGSLDEGGFLYVVDRLKDMIISGSESIYPAELEQVILTHPGVAEVAVVGKPNAKWGEIPVALIVSRPGAEVTAEDIIALCRKNLASYKCVKEVQFISAIPKNAVGKVLKKELRAQLASGG